MTFIHEALSSNNRCKVFVNCVFGKSRSTTCVIAYLMICKGFTAREALLQVKKTSDYKSYDYKSYDYV